MPARFSTNAKGTIVFIELNILIFILICWKKELIQTLDQHHASGAFTTASTTPRTRRHPQNPQDIPRILQRIEKECRNNLLDDLIHTDIPGYQRFVMMSPAVFGLIEEHIHNIKKEVILGSP